MQTSAGDRSAQVLDLPAKLTSTRCHIWALRFERAQMRPDSARELALRTPRRGIKR
jgi:hypothetical protein